MTKEKKAIKIDEDSDKKKKKVSKKVVTKKTAKTKVEIGKKDSSDKTKKLTVKKRVKEPEVEKKSTFIKHKDKIDLSEEKELVDDLVELSESRDGHETVDLRESESLDDDSESEGENADQINLKEEMESRVVLDDGSVNLKAVSADKSGEDLGAVASVISSFKKDAKKNSENKENAVIADSDSEDDNDNEDNKKYRRSVGVYRKMAYFFIFLVVVLVFSVFYLTSIKVTITLIPSQERISSSMMFDVFGKPMSSLSDNAMGGLVEEVLIDHSSVFDATGEEVIGKDATGKAKIINNYNRNQPLVATTRLLSPDGVLFRIRETVNVPAGGEVEVEIYADEPRADMFVGPTKFTIPGLWAGLQDQVYAETSEEITYKQQVKMYVTDVDISNSVKNIRLQLEDVVRQKIEQDYADYGEVIYEIDKESIKSIVNADPGENIDEFNVEMSAKVIVVAFDKIKAAKFAQEKFIAGLAKHKELINFDNDEIKYVVDDYNEQDKVATLKAIFDGRVSLKGWETVIDKKEISGLNREQIEAYAASKDEISGVEVKFYPPFVKKIPKFIESGRIKIDIRK